MRSDRNAPSRADAATAAVGIQVERELLPSAWHYVGVVAQSCGFLRRCPCHRLCDKDRSYDDPYRR
jgi:hypothetical protein